MSLEFGVSSSKFQVWKNHCEDTGRCGGIQGKEGMSFGVDPQVSQNARWKPDGSCKVSAERSGNAWSLFFSGDFKISPVHHRFLLPPITVPIEYVLPKLSKILGLAYWWNPLFVKSFSQVEIEFVI